MVKKFDHSGPEPVLTEVLHRESVNGSPWRAYQPTSPLNRGRILDAAEGRIEKTRDKVALIFGPDPAAPLMDDTWEVWSGHSHWKDCLDTERYFRADRWFNLTSWCELTHVELCDLLKCPIPIYLREVSAHLENGVRYPYERVQHSMSGGEVAPLVSALDHQLALAVLEGFATIAIFGMATIDHSLLWWQAHTARHGTALTCTVAK